MSRKVLVVEDEESIRKFIKINLDRAGYTVLEAPTGEEGLEIAGRESIDIVVLDVMLPGIDGFEVCRSLRADHPHLGIVMLTAKSQDIDKIMGLEYGTDDYMTKPFNPTELVLRIKSLERRLEAEGSAEASMLEFPPFKIDVYSRLFYRNGKEIELTPTEFSIAKLFMENPGKAFKRDEILNHVWGVDFVGDSKIVDVNIRRLRSKIEEDSSQPYYIETVWGVGYRWRAKS
ncbi:MAG: response regulator transcription factor [Gudongella sp.]|nr:response regulator transcription factor [Gudongella sp.]